MLSTLKTIKAKRTYLELLNFSYVEKHRKKIEDISSIDNLRIELAINCPPSFYLYLYRQVGYEYYWRSKLSWSEEKISAYLAQPNIFLWILYCDGVPAGYFELKLHDNNSCEIRYLGLIEEFINKGLGKVLLVNAIDKAKETCSRIWLGTSTLDRPKAMINYLAFGFEPFKEEEYSIEIEDNI